MFQAFSDAVFSGGIRLTGNANIKYGTLSDWRLVYRDDFNDVTSQGWLTSNGQNATAGFCGVHRILTGNNPNIKKTFIVTHIPHNEVKVVLEYYAIDSWDGEWAYVSLTDEDEGLNGVWNRTISHTDPGRKNFCGSGWKDGIYRVELSGGSFSRPAQPPSKMVNNIIVTVGSNLNQAASDESFGIDNVEIWVR